MRSHQATNRPVRCGPLRVSALFASVVAIACSTLSFVGPLAGSRASGAAAPAAVLAAKTTDVSGCGVAAPSSGSTTLTLEVAGRVRTVIVHIPTGYTAQTKVPLVLNMHGSGGTAASQEAFTGMDAESDAEGFIVAYPQALIPSGAGFDWNIPGVPLRSGAQPIKNPPDDMAFLSGLPQILEQRYCVSTSHVYATGFSGGARITSQLACDDSNVFAAVAPVSGLRRPTPCPTVRPVPVLSFHGTADPVDPYNGHGEAYWTYSVPEAERYWATQDGCKARPVMTTPAPGATLTAYTGCRAHVSVELYSLIGEGHEWPDGPKLAKALTRVLGPQSDAVNADALIWAFFAAHPKP
jgi:polyhydroxybutyrate depolymerase